MLCKGKHWRKVSFFSVHPLASPDLQKLLSVLSVKPPGKPAPPGVAMASAWRRKFPLACSSVPSSIYLLLASP